MYYLSEFYLHDQSNSSTNYSYSPSSKTHTGRSIQTCLLNSAALSTVFNFRSIATCPWNVLTRPVAENHIRKNSSIICKSTRANSWLFGLACSQLNGFRPKMKTSRRAKLGSAGIGVYRRDRRFFCLPFESLNSRTRNHQAINHRQINFPSSKYQIC